MAARSRRRRVAPRGAPVVRRAVQAALDELARVGYASLRIEDVADRAKVNKTTVYRRWPTKDALVRDALLSLVERYDGFVVPDTGSLRGDLTVIVKRQLRFAQSPDGRAILRILGEGTPDANLMAITRTLRGNGSLVIRAVIERARAQGAVRPGLDVALLVQLLQTACDRLRTQQAPLGPRYVDGLVSLLLDGALSQKDRNSKLRS
jgi:AcrR family transcriptional regulator